MTFLQIFTFSNLSKYNSLPLKNFYPNHFLTCGNSFIAISQSKKIKNEARRTINSTHSLQHLVNLWRNLRHQNLFSQWNTLSFLLCKPKLQLISCSSPMSIIFPGTPNIQYPFIEFTIEVDTMKQECKLEREYLLSHCERHACHPARQHSTISAYHHLWKIWTHQNVWGSLLSFRLAQDNTDDQNGLHVMWPITSCRLKCFVL